MDEPTSALDPISTSKIEELMEDLKKKYTVVVVTHTMQQEVRVSDDTAFFLVGDMGEFVDTKTICSYPQDKRTAVSYTHLDVYKRQIMYSKTNGLFYLCLNDGTAYVIPKVRVMTGSNDNSSLGLYKAVEKLSLIHI